MNIDRVRSISDNVWIIFTARLAMIATPMVASALVWLGSNWLDEKFKNISLPVQLVEVRVDTLERSDRISELKNQSQDFMIQANVTSITKMIGQMDRLGSKLDELNASLKSLNDVLADRERRATRGQP